MKAKGFDVLVSNRLGHCAKVLASKDKEYSSDEDRLHNFVAAGRIDNECAEKALWGMWKKHIVSIRDMIERMEKDRDYCPSYAVVSEKLGDNINYTLLLEGLIIDRRNRLNNEGAPSILDRRA